VREAGLSRYVVSIKPLASFADFSKRRFRIGGVGQFTAVRATPLLARGDTLSRCSLARVPLRPGRILTAFPAYESVRLGVSTLVSIDIPRGTWRAGQEKYTSGRGKGEMAGMVKIMLCRLVDFGCNITALGSFPSLSRMLCSPDLHPQTHQGTADCSPLISSPHPA
jgi:hypothetical protein